MVVVDASLAVKIAIDETYTEKARELARFWETERIPLAAPDFMPSEYASALRKKIQEGILNLDDASQLITALYASGIEFRSSRLLHDRAIDLAMELNQRLAYDAHYLALAESLDCDFWTADEPFYRAARGLYPHVQWIGSYTPN